MEFKIAVIGSKLYGDLGLIIKDATRPPQTAKGFNDEELKALITKGTGNFAVSNITVKDREGRQTIQFAAMKELAE